MLRSPFRANPRVSCLTAAVVCALLLLPSTTRAGQFIPITVDDLATRSAVIVVGRVEATLAQPNGPHGLEGIHTRVRFTISETLAGDAHGSLDFWVHGGHLGSRLRHITGQARFAPGEELLLFLFEDPDGALWPSGMARGKWRLQTLGGQRWATPAAALDGTEAAPLSSASSAVRPTLSLDDLRRRIRAARAVEGSAR